ncbi:MAG TPA: tetratricopeptide repeat protein [Candidatus Sulfotelmatobacter sp.]|nr:tetratricopeptide repeat protein [Candidatus Sulfotelmatobacter sp.]HWI62209.1 tetratricopeptide repeat protein [Symbiobacteriaceae bacterium]
MAVDRLHSLVATGQFLAAYREVERLAMDPDLDPAFKAKVFILGVRAAAGLREIYAGVKMAEKAIEAAELGTDWDDIGNARLHSALIYREVGDTAQALRFFQLFFMHLDRYPTLQTKTAHAYYNQGLTHQQRREHEQALESYRLAAEDFARIGHRAGVLASLQNSAWVMLMQSRPAEAEPFIAQAEALSSELEIPEYQVTQLAVVALYERLMQRPERTMALCEEIFQSGRQGATDRHRAEAAWMMAELSLEARRLHEAGIFADWAVTHALEAKDPHLMNLACDIRQRVRRKQSELQLG